jgi:hypothetical protein
MREYFHKTTTLSLTLSLLRMNKKKVVKETVELMDEDGPETALDLLHRVSSPRRTLSVAPAAGRKPRELLIVLCP